MEIQTVDSKVEEFWNCQKKKGEGTRIQMGNGLKGFITNCNLYREGVALKGTFKVKFDDNSEQEFNPHGLRHAKYLLDNRLFKNQSEYETAYKRFCELFQEE